MTEEQVFLAALDLPNPSRRTLYLDSVCGTDTELRRQVEELLAAHFKSGEFLNEPVGDQLGTAPITQVAETLIVAHKPDEDAVPGQDSSRQDPDHDVNDLNFLEPSTRPDSLGRIGHYETLEVLGKGGFGIVFRAFDDVLQRVVAVKVMAPAIATTSPARKRFLREAQASARVRHENVVQVHAVEELPIPYLVMEFIAGETLQQRLDRKGPLDTVEIVSLGRQIAEGLAAAHATGLIHRDIKPGNVLIEKGTQERVKITDFGLARAADDASMTQSGVVAGTPMFMAPEQAQGDTLDQRADLFSLGSVLYVMASGRPPFRAATTFAVLKRVVEETPRPIQDVIPETPQWLCDIIAKLHAKQPEERFQSAREVADVLADCEAQLKANAKLQDFSRIPRTQLVSRGSGWQKWAAIAAVVLFFAAIALAQLEFAGVTHLFRHPARIDANTPGGEPAPIQVAKQEPSLALAPFGATQAKEHQKAWASHLGVQVECTNSIGMKFVLLPPGEFTMGSPNDEIEYAVRAAPEWAKKHVESEGPAHRARVERPFLLGIHEVTVGQFRQFVAATGYLTESEKDLKGGWMYSSAQQKMVQDRNNVWRNPAFCESDDHPVVFVSMQDAQSFCAWLSESEGRQYVLPSETQWEYACRAGTQTAWNWGKDETQGLNQCWSFANSDAKSHKVGSKLANPFGLHDMAGNVIEIGLDYRNKPASRGGSFFLNWVSLRSASRIPNDTEFPAAYDRGFRVAIVGDLKPQLAKQELPPIFKNDIGMEFVKVPKGKSWLGGGNDKVGDQVVVIPADFYLGKYEVTQEEWVTVMGENPSWLSHTGGGKDAVKDVTEADLKRSPVENVTWDQCQLFVEKLNHREQETGWVYRLPTEAEWEYACRGGPMSNKVDSAFDFYLTRPTNVLLPEQANFKHDNSLNRTCKVGSYAPNALGLHDMHGNAWEWCQDEFAADPKDPDRVLQGVSRGSGWYQEVSHCRAANRYPRPRTRHFNDLGLRLARVRSDVSSPEPQTPPLVADVLKDAALLMDFEKDSFYEKEGKTYVRDLSGNGNDGLCEGVSFTTAGKAGGGLECEGGSLQVPKSLINGQPNYTIALWGRRKKNENKLKESNEKLFLTSKAKEKGAVYAIEYQRDGRIYTAAYDLAKQPNTWLNYLTKPSVALPEDEWFFLTVTLSGGDTEKADLRVMVNDLVSQGSLQLVNAHDDKSDFLCNEMTDFVLDEVAIFQRALTVEEIAAVRALGLNGTPFSFSKTPLVAPFTDAEVQRIAALPAKEQVEEVGKELVRRNPNFDGNLESKIDGDVVIELKFLTDEIVDISPVRALQGLVSLKLSPTMVPGRRAKLSDISPLMGLPLTHLDLSCTHVTNIEVLREMPLKDLSLDRAPVSDLSPLTGKVLKSLHIGGTKVKSLSDVPVAKSEVIFCHLPQISDKSELQRLGVRFLDLWGVPTTADPARLSELKPTLSRVNGKPLEEFLKDLKSGMAPFTDADVKRIAALPAAQQIEEVRKELIRLNPKFDGKLTPTTQNDTVTELSINTDEVENIAPVRALTKLVYLDCRGTYPYNGKLSDLSPLKGMSLSRLDCSSTQVADLTPLADLPLTTLHFNHNPVTDLTPLKKMPLESLGLAETKVLDLSPLKGMKIKTLGAQVMMVTDLSPLEGMPLTGLDLYHTVGVTSLEALKGMPLDTLNIQDVPIADLSPLKGMATLRTLLLQANKVTDLSPLTGLKLTDLILSDKAITDLSALKGLPLVRLHIYDSGTSDLRPLEGMPLAEIRFNPKNITSGLEILRGIKSLETIGIDGDHAWPAAEFWQRHEKGEFNK